MHALNKPMRIIFNSGGVNCVGYLYLPANTTDKLPCVVMGTGFGGTQDTPSIISNAEKFTKAGFAALTFDYRSLGESEGQPRQVVSIKGQIEDFHAAISYIRNHEAIDPERIALWGSSLGGGHVITVAAEDSQIAAVVSQIPFNGFPKNVEGRSSKDTRKVLAAMLKDMLRVFLGMTPYYIPAVGSVGELAVMASSQAQKTIDAMNSKYWRNEVAPRALFEMMKYKPSTNASQIKKPVLVCIGEYDRETIGDLTMQILEKTPYGELKSYPVDHFDFYHPDIRKQIINDQIDFLSKHLLNK